MGTIQRLDRLDAGDALDVAALLAAAAAFDGNSPVDQRGWPERGGRTEPGRTRLVARDGAGEGPPVGYAEVVREGDHWAVGVVVDPARRGPAHAIAADLLAAAEGVVAGAGGGRMQRWVSGAGPATERMLQSAGWSTRRALYQMRRPLPVEAARADEEPLPTRPFRVGVDEEAWLRVNNRAFDWHPEQGGWQRADVEGREAEPWFDADGFLLHEDGGRLNGFCWTIVHTDQQPPLGEIYVIAVDPDAGGHGLGRRLVLAGLDYLARRRGVTVGMLYCEADNTRALKLYIDLGFQVHHVDRLYTKDVAPT
ncbi:MAG TPA: mycothiol synthase [Acidimicrobiales bacterium]|nr:mycothiol synthase [Acidimicrobiales bacterium]